MAITGAQPQMVGKSTIPAIDVWLLNGGDFMIR